MVHHWFALTITSLLWLVSVDAIRISPKLDFGEEKKTLNAGIRPDTSNRYLRNDEIAKLSYRKEQIEPSKLETIGIVCISGNCNATKTTTDSENPLSAEVLVHIKTNVDVAKPKNDTLQVVPDVPVVVGSKTTTTENNRPIGIQNPSIYNQNYPALSVLPPLTTNVFVPSSRSRFVQNQQFQPDSQVKDYTGFNTYAPRFQSSDNDIGLQSNYFGSSFNENNYPILPQQTWQPKGVRGVNYNPLEFRKTYTNTWSSPVTWTRSNPTNSGRRTAGTIPRWTPCVCSNPEVHRYSTTPGYPQSDQPAGINGKLTPLA